MSVQSADEGDSDVGLHRPQAASGIHSRIKHRRAAEEAATGFANSEPLESFPA